MDLIFNSSTLFVLVFLIAWWQAFLTFLVWKSLKNYRNLVKNTKGDNLEEMLEDVIDNLQSHDQKTERLHKRLEIAEEKVPAFLQNIGFIRFNPYNEVGGDQSFSLAFLNDHGKGVVITSLHGRNMTRVYAKPVEGPGRKGSYPLSKEEEEAVKLALKRES